MDLTTSDKKSQKGSKCVDKSKEQISKYCQKLQKYKILKSKKKTLCNDLQILFMRKNEEERKNNTKWFLNDVEYYYQLKLSDS